MPNAEEPMDDPREDPLGNDEDEEDTVAGARCPICERAAGECDHLVASIDLAYSEFVAGAIFAHGRLILDALEKLCSSDPDALRAAGAGPVLEHVATLVRNEILEGISPGDALSNYTPHIMAALSLLLQEDEDVTATQVDPDSGEDSVIENLWAQDPEWVVERAIETLEGLVDEIGDAQT